MANPWSGEVAITIDGTPRVMKLTLGALAELEAQLGADTLVALVGRFESGSFAARDVLALLVAGLKGGGWTDCDLATIADADFGGGPLGASRAAAELLARTFSVPGEA